MPQPGPDVIDDGEQGEHALHAVVHELRAPLTVVAGYLHMLREGTFGAEPQAWGVPLDVMAAKLEETRVLVDDLLSLARHEANVDDVSVACVNLAGIADEAVARAQARARIVRGRVTMDTELPGVTAAADRAATRRILDNLINNALLHGGERPLVSVRVEDEPGPQIAVEDAGPGVPTDLRERIFDRFVRDRSDKAVGSGLGLFLSRTLALRMGGDLVLDESGRVSGSRFVLRLPTAPDAPVDERALTR